MDLMAFQSILKAHALTGAYFSTPGCRVCVSVKPGITELFAANPEFHLLSVNCKNYPAISGQYLVFSVPTLILFQNGRESARFSRFIDVSEVEQAMLRMHPFTGVGDR